MHTLHGLGQSVVGLGIFSSLLSSQNGQGRYYGQMSRVISSARLVAVNPISHSLSCARCMEHPNSPSLPLKRFVGQNLPSPFWCKRAYMTQPSPLPPIRLFKDPGGSAGTHPKEVRGTPREGDRGIPKIGVKNPPKTGVKNSRTQDGGWVRPESPPGGGHRS